MYIYVPAMIHISARAAAVLNDLINLHVMYVQYVAYGWAGICPPSSSRERDRPGRESNVDLAFGRAFVAPFSGSCPFSINQPTDNPIEAVLPRQMDDGFMSQTTFLLKLLAAKKQRGTVAQTVTFN